jgi:predicted nucleic acid-binding protein
MLLDTSGLYCYLNAADPLHGDAVSLLDSALRRLTHNYVLTELIALCTARKFPRPITLDFAERLVRSSDVQMYWVTEEDHSRAMQLLRMRQDKSYSLCDAVSFELMRRHGTTEALTTDHHFEQEGFVRLLKP